MDLDEQRDFVHTGPGTLAGRYLRQFWQPVARSEDVAPGRARPVRVMGEAFTVYRGEGGRPYIIDSRCPHRGTQLSAGWVEGEEIRCFYHGWKFDGAGACVEQPAEDASFAAKVRIRSCAAVERYGLVFGFFGEGEPPAPPALPMLDGPGLIETSRYGRACNFFNSLDNHADPVHVAFTHRTSAFTDAGLAGVPSVGGEETDYGVAVRATRQGQRTRVTHMIMPNLVYITVPIAFVGGWQDQVAWRVPVDDHSHVSFISARLPLTDDQVRRYREGRAAAAERLRGTSFPTVEEAGRAILAGDARPEEFADHPQLINIQDYVSQIGQGSQPWLGREHLGRSDVALILHRRVWERELSAFAAGHGCTAWRIPADLAAVTGV